MQPISFIDNCTYVSKAATSKVLAIQVQQELCKLINHTVICSSNTWNEALWSEI
jgi:hypothetical protein